MFTVIEVVAMMKIKTNKKIFRNFYITFYDVIHERTVIVKYVLVKMERKKGTISHLLRW